MKDSGMSYKDITKYLNNNNILTHTGKRWGVSGNSVHSVLKKNIERLRKLKILDKEIVLNSMRLKWNLKIDEFKKLTKNLKFN